MALFCAPSMGALLEVKVLPQADHSERSEAQLHEGNRVWEGSVERKTVSRGTQTASEAAPSRASRQETAKLLWSKRGDVNAAIVR